MITFAETYGLLSEDGIAGTRRNIRRAMQNLIWKINRIQETFAFYFRGGMICRKTWEIGDEDFGDN